MVKNIIKSTSQRGKYKTLSLEEKQEVIDSIEQRGKTFEELSSIFNTTTRRIKAIYNKRGKLQKSGRISRNISENKFLFEKGLEFFQRFQVRPSILALPKFYLNDQQFFKSNGQKTNFTKNFKIFLERNGCPTELVDLSPLNESQSTLNLGSLPPMNRPLMNTCYAVTPQKNLAQEIFFEDKDNTECFFSDDEQSSSSFCEEKNLEFKENDEDKLSLLEEFCPSPQIEQKDENWIGGSAHEEDQQYSQKFDDSLEDWPKFDFLCGDFESLLDI